MGRLKDDYPALFTYGGEHEFLSNEAARSATAEERIRSVWPFLAQRVLAFHKTLKPRERANFDPEDVLLQVWIELAKRDELWEAGRGRYITFAGAITDHALSDIRDKARTVQSPRNSKCRIKEYETEQAAGTISPIRAKTFNDIRRSSGEFEAIRGDEKRSGDNPTAEAMEREAKTLARDAVALAIRGLEPIEAAVVGWSFGLWGKSEKTIAEIATITGRSPDGIKRIRALTLTKIRERLQDLGHPAIDELVA